MSALEEIEVATDTLLRACRHDPLKYVRAMWPWGEAGTPLEHEAGPKPWQAQFLRDLGAAHRALADSKVRPAHVAALVKLVDSGAVLTNAAKEIFIEMFATGEMPEAIADRRGLKAAPTDTGELEQWCRDSVAANAKAVAEFKAGKDSAINAFKGPVMKAAKGKANPKLVDETLRRLLAGM